MLTRFRQRSSELEHLDKGDYTPEEYEGCIVELQRVNRWLGDTRALRTTLLQDIETSGVQKFSVLDVGAGSGELLRVIAEWARETKRAARLVGIELNARSARAIVDESSQSEISAARADAFKLPFKDNQFDYGLCSLFTHHFKNDAVVAVLKELARVSRRKIVVIDLHRHPIAYALFTSIAPLFLHNRLIREDGALSILRSFKPHELKSLATAAGLCDVKVVRRFPFRLVLTAGEQDKANVAKVEVSDEHRNAA